MISSHAYVSELAKGASLKSSIIPTRTSTHVYPRAQKKRSRLASVSYDAFETTIVYFFALRDFHQRFPPNPSPTRPSIKKAVGSGTAV